MAIRPMPERIRNCSRHSGPAGVRVSRLNSPPRDTVAISGARPGAAGRTTASRTRTSRSISFSVTNPLSTEYRLATLRSMRTEPVTRMTANMTWVATNVRLSP